ncbi:ribosomal protein S18 [Dissoconium aciculare CBS 342.82]|uniref:Small ribosomal subunit protein bS18m n=1 Tax=Dissoconium aciculare CBS 342.82 TaxID=1314786 RepID=A0A6J3LRM8_9PEZI|nr:ribosomal protein S18 [Dissoconium aciculare CBS 342.82]KAF1818486.1 ribosomal protein S18 [Dissoconium aciculare CBS 342.82]
MDLHNHDRPPATPFSTLSGNSSGNTPRSLFSRPQPNSRATTSPFPSQATTSEPSLDSNDGNYSATAAIIAQSAQNYTAAHLDIATKSLVSAGQGSGEALRLEAIANGQRGYTSQDLDKQVTRRWRAGDVYAPHDLSGIEMAKWKRLRRKDRPRYDVLDLLGIDPLLHYKNFSIMSEYMTSMGRIKHISETGLRPVNQRKMAKAIRRAIGIGLIPSTHAHPEMFDRRFLR